MDKSRLIKQIVASLSQSLGVLEKAARASHAEATHESSKAESKYDTRGLEAAYLAGGHLRQRQTGKHLRRLKQSFPITKCTYFHSSGSGPAIAPLSRQSRHFRANHATTGNGHVISLLHTRCSCQCHA